MGTYKFSKYLCALFCFGLIGCATLDPCYYYAGKNNDTAIEECSKVINSYKPNFLNKWSGAIFYNNRGVAYFNKGLNALAMKDFNVATELKPNFALPYYNRGRIYHKLKQYDLAIAEFDKAKAFDPKYNMYNTVIIRALLIESLKADTPIYLAIIMGSISNVYSSPLIVIEQWKEGMKSLLISTQETYYMDMLKNDPKFSLIAREKSERILNEQRFQNSGLTSSPVEIGKLIGATHILVVDFSRYSSDKSAKKFEDVETHTLLEVKSGRILSSQVFRRLGD